MLLKPICRKSILHAVAKKTISVLFAPKILLILLIVFHFTAHYHWVANNDFLRDEVEHEHVPKSIYFSAQLSKSPGQLLQAINEIKQKKFYWPTPRPPALYIISAIIMRPFGFFFSITINFFYISSSPYNFYLLSG